MRKEVFQSCWQVLMLIWFLCPDLYAGQTRYRTKTDREKDAAAEAATITMPEMARLLGVPRSTVYSILSNPKYKDIFEITVIADKKRITKDSFQRFLDSQSQYQLAPLNDYKEVAAEENMALADYRRKRLYKSGKRKGNGNQEYLTKSEAALLANVSLATIVYWADQGHYTMIIQRSGNDGMRREIEAYSEIIRENIEIDILRERYPYEKELIDGIYDLILETVLCKNDVIIVASNRYPAELVRSKFLKLNSSHIEYAIDCFKSNTTKVRNIKKYLLTTLFNAPSTISGYYQAEVNHDFPQYAVIDK